jgi:hypothetical protein
MLWSSFDDRDNLSSFGDHRREEEQSEEQAACFTGRQFVHGGTLALTVLFFTALPVM